MVETNTHSDELSFYAAAKIQLARVEDATIATRVFGHGPALVFIHGYPVHGYTWRKLLPTLAEQFTCYVVDLPGLGDSQWLPNSDFSFTAQARRLELWLESLNLFPYGLIAHDTGATIARLIAISRPDRLRKLVLINTEIPGHRPQRVSIYRQVASMPGGGIMFSILLRSSRFIKSAMGEFYSDPSLLDDPSYIDPYVKPLIISSKRMAGALGYLRGIEWDVVDRMREWHAKIRADTLMLWGEDDQTFPVKIAEEMCGQLKAQTTFIRIPNASLLPHEERPDIVLKHLMSFLNK